MNRKTISEVLSLLFVVGIAFSIFYYINNYINKSNVDNLIEKLKDKDYYYIRRDAAEALGQMKDARAVEPLIAALKDEDSHVRKSAAKALEQMKWQPKDDREQVVWFIAKQNWNELVKLGAVAVEPLIAALKDKDYEKDSHVRENAAKALGQIKDARAVELLIAALKDKDFEVSTGAADALGQSKDARAVEPLIAALKDENWSVRIGAAKALGQIKAACAVEPLIAALKDKDKYVRIEAVRALGQSKDARVVEPLIAALKDEAPYVRQSVVWVLREIKDARAVEPLIAALKDENSYVRGDAATALEQMKWQPKDDREKTVWFIATRNWNELVKLGTVAVEPLIAALKDKDKYVRQGAVEALGQIKDARAVEPLVLKLTDWELKESAWNAIKQISWQPRTDAERIHAWVASQKTTELNSQWTLTCAVLLKDVESGNREIIEYALYTFIALGKKEIIPSLVETLNIKGDKTMAEAYLNCGCTELKDAAVKWATQHGYQIQTGSGNSPIRWGQW
jgi:HEAT repeat protein